MEWKIKIEGKPSQRIVVRFDSLNKQLIFVGQFKPHNVEWVDFVEIKEPIWLQEIIPPINSEMYNGSKPQPFGVKEVLIDGDRIQKIITKVYDELKKRLEAYIEINEGFQLIKLIAEEPDETEVK